MKREDVEALLTLAKLAGPMRRECAVPSDTLAALCRAWLALDGAEPVRVTGSGHTWAGGGKTTLEIEGVHAIELLRHYRIVPTPNTAEGEDHG